MKDEPLHLEIKPIIKRAEGIAELVRHDLVDHQGLLCAAQGVLNAAKEAERVSKGLRRCWSIHRLPALFLAIVLLSSGIWIYWNYFHVSRLRIALPTDDAYLIHNNIDSNRRVYFEQLSTSGSLESVQLLTQGQIDLAFVQGGIPLPDNLARLKNRESEVVLYFVRRGLEHPAQIRTVLTSAKNQGSHFVAQQFFRLLGRTSGIQFRHEWHSLVESQTYQIPAEIDAIFVIKDLKQREVLAAIKQIVKAGFLLESFNIGIHAESLDFLQPATFEPAYFDQELVIPDKNFSSYSVSTYLVAREGISAWQLAAAGRLLDSSKSSLIDPNSEPSVSDVADALQGIEAALSIFVYLGIAFLALLGLEVATYRRRFHELNTLISLISMHQSSKEIIGLSDEQQRFENLRYLSICSDLLGLIGVIGGYYSQENSSLLYSGLLDIIYERSDRLKLNIQAKITQLLLGR